ncbi:MerR HTH family regulatory protein [Arthrobacter crystallopoietes]|jgi:MerR family transcriptional regulator, heat shock protein HspR|uniref:MerR HTH family regulatory protein n=1 Tax=Crystallibacter crystallopoietes TaxID=37928 RepID=A0A1H1AZ84_9MICC|nr:MerR HTH family regulatory protein [Arthrobacter crystallopoietes]
MSADTDIMTLRYNILQEVRRKKLSKDDERRLRAEQGVYGISVAADLVGVGQQTLRLYERKGLVEPERTEGGTRRYSENDVERMRRIGELVDDGLNLAGVDKVLRLEEINAALQRELDVAKERDRGQKRPANQR